MDVEVGNGYIVSWCVGHLVELAEPEVYDEKYSKWTYNDLPIFPIDWQFDDFILPMQVLLMHASVERGNQVRVLSDPVTVSRERGSNIHCMSSAYEKESQAMICKSGNLLV